MEVEMPGDDLFGRIVKQVAAIDNQIWELQRQKRDILLSDQEYAEYLAQFECSDRPGEPLSYAGYYAAVARLQAVNDAIMGKTDEEFEAAWRKHRKELTRLEHLVFA